MKAYRNTLQVEIHGTLQVLLASKSVTITCLSSKFLPLFSRWWTLMPNRPQLAGAIGEEVDRSSRISLSAPTVGAVSNADKCIRM